MTESQPFGGNKTHAQTHTHPIAYETHHKHTELYNQQQIIDPFLALLCHALMHRRFSTVFTQNAKKDF